MDRFENATILIDTISLPSNLEHRGRQVQEPFPDFLMLVSYRRVPPVGAASGTANVSESCHVVTLYLSNESADFMVHTHQGCSSAGGDKSVDVWNVLRPR